MPPRTNVLKLGRPWLVDIDLTHGGMRSTLRKILCCTDARRAVVRDLLVRVVVVHFAMQPCITLPCFFFLEIDQKYAPDYVKQRIY